MATSSISTGCFVFKPSKTSRLNEKRVFGRASTVQQSESIVEHDVYMAEWNTASSLIEEFRSQIYSSVFEDMFAMLKKSPEGGDTLPTAVLVSGVNLPDHQSMYVRLRDRLYDLVTDRVCLLGGTECGSSLKTAVRTVVAQLMTTGSNADDQTDTNCVGIDDGLSDGDDDVPPTAAVDGKQTRRLGNATMPVLLDHYQKHLGAQTVDVSGSGRSPLSPVAAQRGVKRARNGSHQEQEPKTTQQPLVVIFKDLEMFTPSVLQDLLLILSQYRLHMPLAVVLGVATSVDIVHRLLPHHVSSNLTLTTFVCLTSSHCLQKFVDKVLLSDSLMFRLGGKVLRLLLDVFLYNDFSINNFIAGYQYCMLEHFLSAAGVLLCQCSDTSLTEAVTQLSRKQLGEMRQLPSVVSHFKALSEDERLKLAKENHFRSWLVETIKQTRLRCRQSVVALRCLFTLASRLPGHMLGHQFRELYSVSLLHPLAEQEGYTRVVQLLSMMSKPELTLALQTASAAIDDEAVSDRLQRHLASVEGVDESAVAVEADESDGASKTEEKSSDNVKGILRGATNYHSLKERLQAVAEIHGRHKNAYERVRETVISDLCQYFRETVTLPSSWTLCEVFVFDDVAAVRRRIVGAPRVALQTALADPARYLQCECCQLTSDSGSISATMPDLCIVYKLHLECGPMINVFDWLQSFQAIIGADAIDDVLQARFARAVAELQFLGFIRPTRRKTDHVARLTWGSC